MEAQVQEAFQQYMDHVVVKVLEAGVPESLVLDTVFTVADFLTEEGVLPPFPDDRSSVEEQGQWLVAAADNGFVDLVVEAVDV